MPIKEGVEARYKYQRVKYCHILIDPAESAVLTADPWSFLHGYLLGKIKGSAGANRRYFERAQYYSGLAEDFLRAAESVNMPTKGTLCYYGMMNLVKSLLSVNKVKLEEVVEHHGVTNTHGKKYSLTISGKMRDCTNIFMEFANLLGTPVVGKHEMNLRHIFYHIPELNGISINMGLISKPKFLPVDISLKVNESATKLFSEVIYSKGSEMLCDQEKFLKGQRTEYFCQPYERGSQVVYRSSKQKNLNKDNWPRVYKNILREYSKLGFSSMLTRSGYRYYLNIQDGSYHHLCNAYLLMFYLGHSARYRPTEIEDVMHGELRAIATEAVSILPKQFVYQLISLITGKLCVIPYAHV